MTVEQTRSIDILHWYQLGYLQCPAKFSWVWTRDSERVAFLVAENNGALLHLEYSGQAADGKWHEIQQCVVIDWTPCWFGGERPWFLCDCGRKAVALYAGRGKFACQKRDSSQRARIKINPILVSTRDPLRSKEMLTEGRKGAGIPQKSAAARQ
jgi:hypothetical protein